VIDVFVGGLDLAELRFEGVDPAPELPTIAEAGLQAIGLKLE
jgi:hypothetical protein